MSGKSLPRQAITIDTLPDDVLLEIFDFYLVEDPFRENDIDAWQLLVRVCRRWRCVVLDIWPALPLLIYGDVSMSGADNTIAALERSDRVCTIDLDIGSSQLENVSAVMEAPFPELTDLSLTLKDGTASVIPDYFWMDLPHVCGFSTWMPFHFGDCRTTHVCQSSRRPSPFKYSSFRVYFTRGDGHLPLRIGQPQRNLP